MSATLEGVRVRLTSAALMAFEALARSAGRVQSRETLTYQALVRPLEGARRCAHRFRRAPMRSIFVQLLDHAPSETIHIAGDDSRVTPEG